MKKTVNQKLMDEIYSQVSKKDNYYYPKDVRKIILHTIKVMKSTALTERKSNE